MAESRELLISWLKDAHAMEQGQIPVLKNHARDAKDYPAIRERDERHITETEQHIELVRSCLERLGEKPSRTKSTMGTIMGGAQSVSGSGTKDELVKNFLMDYASENLEIASYSALVTAARNLGEEDVAQTCERILRDERDMARWLEDNLPMAVRETLRT